MIKDKFKKETYFTIDYYDLDDILRKEYDAPDYEVALDQSNDSTVSVSVYPEFNEFMEEDFQNFLETKSQEYNTTRILLHDLCRKGKIDEGNYLINVSW